MDAAVASKPRRSQGNIRRKSRFCTEMLETDDRHTFWIQSSDKNLSTRNSLSGKQFSNSAMMQICYRLGPAESFLNYLLKLVMTFLQNSGGHEVSATSIFVSNALISFKCLIKHCTSLTTSLVEKSTANIKQITEKNFIFVLDAC
jgi:hypothetical protein